MSKRQEMVAFTFLVKTRNIAKFIKKFFSYYPLCKVEVDCAIFVIGK